MPKTPFENTRFGRLTVIADVLGGWLCECDCGQETIVTGTNLRSGNTASCGCLHRELQKSPKSHGMSNNRTYNIWCNIIQRCTNPVNPSFKNYGGRGITVCQRWKNSFINFLEDMGECPSGLTIERKNNEKCYCANNCVWTTRKEQTRNTRRSKKFEINNEIKTLVEWCEFFGKPYFTVHARLRRGKTIYEALEIKI